MSTHTTGKGCLKCGHLGHWARDCQTPRDQWISSVTPASRDQPNENNGTAEKEAENQTTAAAAVKNKRKRPAVTFDMLKQNRGLPELFHNFPLIFKDQYRGRGHEVSDLRRLLEMYKRWQQRLFPFADFDSFIDSVEKIGYSHIVKSEIHEMRADILKKACKSYREWLNDVNDGLQDGHAQMAEDNEMHLALQPTLADVADAIDDDDTELLRIAFEEEARDQHDKAEDVDEDEMALQVDMLEDEELLELAMQTTQAE